MNYNGLIDLLAAHQADILCDSATKVIKELVRQVEYEQLCASELELQLAEVTKQRDELLAALGSGGRHCNDDTPHSDLCEAIIDSKEADLGQGLDPFWKWAFRRGFHEAETSYKVDIATLEQQRDELLAALLEISQVACDMSPEKKFADDAIASVKGQK